MTLGERIEAFWDWFILNKSLLEDVVSAEGHIETENIIHALDQHILGMGKLKWELGNPEKEVYIFTLSPNNDRELLKLTKSITAQGPEFKNWSFFHATQSNGSPSVQMYDSLMDIQNINAESWRVALHPDMENRFELIIEAKNIMHLDEDTQTVAADLILTNLLGEEIKILKLSGFDLVDQLDPQTDQDAIPISQLPFSI